MQSNYDNVAWFYDRLSRLVYGQTLVKAQTEFLHLIPAGAMVLIAGGGTGFIIEEIAKVHPAGLQIIYVELSEKMMALSKKRNAGGNTIIFINSPVEDAELSADFDVLITPFLFDNFSADTFTKVFGHLDSLLRSGGLWLNTDFQLTGKWWQKPLLKSMYLFFKILGCMEASGLAEINSRFRKAGYIVITEKTFFGEFIGTTAWCKA